MNIKSSSVTVTFYLGGAVSLLRTDKKKVNLSSTKNSLGNFAQYRGVSREIVKKEGTCFIEKTFTVTELLSTRHSSTALRNCPVKGDRVGSSLWCVIDDWKATLNAKNHSVKWNID